MENKIRILIARGDVLGDVILSTAIIKPLKKKFPDAEIYFLINPDYIPILEPIPEITGFIPNTLPYLFKKRNYFKARKLGKSLRSYDFDIYIGLWENPYYGIVAKAAHIQFRIGAKVGFLNKRYHSHTVKIPFLDYTAHKIEHNMLFLKPLGIENPPIDLLLKENTAVTQKLKNKYAQLQNKYICIHIEASGLHKSLPSEQFINTIKYIQEKYKLPIILFGRPRDAALLPELKTNINLLNLAGKINLAETCSLIANCAWYFGADSGPAHIAAAFKKPSIIYYNTRIQNSLQWGPWKTQHIILKATHTCNLKCDPITCKTMICRLGINQEEITDAITQLNQNLFPKDQKAYWLEKELNVLVIGNIDPSLKTQLEKFRHWEIDKKSKIKDIINSIIDHNINYILCSNTSIKIKYRIAKAIASNYIYFYPKLTKSLSLPPSSTI
jgi:ADP-heptose:LPS heptosyltransferase